MPNAPLQAAFERSGRTAAEVARDLGWRRRDGTADGQRVLRALGLEARYGKGYVGGRLARGCLPETAERLAGVLGLDPWEVGL